MFLIIFKILGHEKHGDLVIWCFAPLSTLFRPYRDDGMEILKGSLPKDMVRYRTSSHFLCRNKNALMPSPAIDYCGWKIYQLCSTAILGWLIDNKVKLLSCHWTLILHLWSCVWTLVIWLPATKVNLYNTLGLFSRWQICDIFFLFFSERDNCVKYQILFSGKNMKIFQCRLLKIQVTQSAKR